MCLRSDSTKSFSIERSRRAKRTRRKRRGGGRVSTSFFNEFMKCTVHLTYHSKVSRVLPYFPTGFSRASRISSLSIYLDNNRPPALIYSIHVVADRYGRRVSMDVRCDVPGVLWLFGSFPLTFNCVSSAG